MMTRLVVLFLSATVLLIHQHDLALHAQMAQVSKDQDFAKELLNRFTNGSREEAASATYELFGMGKEAFPLLLKLRGNKEDFPSGLGNPNSSSFSMGDDAVTVEIAAVYLIEAIARCNLRFADSPFLVTKGGDPRIRNTDEQVARAWRAISAWLEADPKARAKSPLVGSGVRFWGSN